MIKPLHWKQIATTKQKLKVLVKFFFMIELNFFCTDLGTGAEYQYHEPTQNPIDPPYKTALEKKRGETSERTESDDVEL